MVPTSIKKHSFSFFNEKFFEAFAVEITHEIYCLKMGETLGTDNNFLSIGLAIEDFGYQPLGMVFFPQQES